MNRPSLGNAKTNFNARWQTHAWSGSIRDRILLNGFARMHLCQFNFFAIIVQYIVQNIACTRNAFASDNDRMCRYIQCTMLKRCFIDNGRSQCTAVIENKSSIGRPLTNHPHEQSNQSEYYNAWSHPSFSRDWFSLLERIERCKAFIVQDAGKLLAAFVGLDCFYGVKKLPSECEGFPWCLKET